MTAGRHREAAGQGAALKTRRAEVVARLAAYGLARGPHRVAGGPRPGGDEGTRCARLRAALEGLGPVFSSFGLYLSTRVDLLHARDCLELSAIADGAPPAPSTSVRELFRREFGCEREEAFPFFEEAPFESRLLCQSHRARLPDGSPVVVKLVRRESEQAFLCDVELLRLLEGALSGVAPGGATLRDAVADFAAGLHRQLDFAHEAKALSALASDAKQFEMLRVPAVHHGLCTQRILTVEELSGERLDGGAFPGGEGDEGAWRRLEARGLERANLARLLCSVWLQQALLGRAFPVTPRPDNILILSARQLAFTGGDFDSLPADSQSNLWDYLRAAAADDPDTACACLLTEVRPGGPPGAAEDLRHRFRQVVPFRDSEWHTGDEVNRLADHLVVHWRSAAECGYAPGAHLPSFYRGLFAVERAARQLSPEGDPLLEGLQDARLLTSLGQMRELLSLNQLGDHLDRYAGLMMLMPQRLDEVLTLGGKGGTRLNLRVAEDASARGRRNSLATVTALLLVLAASALLLPRVTAALGAGEWEGRINAVVFIVLGAAVLRTATRG